MELGILKSLNTSKYKDFLITTEKIAMGRYPNSTIVLSDIRCSGLHCTITPIEKNDWEFIIEDSSSNGTFLIGNLVWYK